MLLILDKVPATLLVVRAAVEKALLPLVAGSLEVFVDVPGGGHHHLAGAHGAHLAMTQGAVILRVPQPVETNKLPYDGLKEIF